MYAGAITFFLVLIGSYSQVKTDQSPPLRGPPVVEKAPVLIHSYLPASMQIIAHLTDLMKYELRPTQTTSTTTTVRPTPHHRPGIYSPKDPLGATAYFAKESSYQEYLDRLKSSQSTYFDRYRHTGRNDNSDSDGNLLQNVDMELLDEAPKNILQQISRVDDYDFVDDDDQVRRFNNNYDDFDFRQVIVGNKKSPPTKAYVTLLSLYDALNKESKKLQLSKYGGYIREVLFLLGETSKGTSRDQLKIVLNKMLENKDTQDQQIVMKINTVLTDLQPQDSYLNDALKYIPPLQFLP